MRPPLQVILFTHNRADNLERTLARLADTFLRDCPVTVLDNASTDHTRAVCARFAPVYADLEAVHRPLNLGACLNFFDALYRAGAARSPYTWILCDDDEYDPAALAQLHDTLTSARSDLVLVGSPGLGHHHCGYRGGVQTAIARGLRFYFVATFIPGMVFRSDLVSSEIFEQSYPIIGSHWPHFPFIHSLVRDDRSLQVLDRPAIFRKGGGEIPAGLYHWCRCASTIREERWRHVAVRDYYPDHTGARALADVLSDLRRGRISRAQIVELWGMLPWSLPALKVGLPWLALQPRRYLETKHRWLGHLRQKLAPRFAGAGP